MQQYKVKFNYEDKEDGTAAEVSRTIIDTGKVVDFPNVVVDVLYWVGGLPHTAIIERTEEESDKAPKQITAPVKKGRKPKAK